jgi:hypothetical protein
MAGSPHATGGGALSFDDSAWPIVVGTCPERLTEASMPELIVFFQRVHARKEPFAMVIDTRRLQTMPGAKWRQEIVAWSTQPTIEANTRRYNVGTSVVLSSVLARGVFVALGWLRKPVAPLQTHATLGDGLAWCTEMLAAAGVPLSAKARALAGAR